MNKTIQSENEDIQEMRDFKVWGVYLTPHEVDQFYLLIKIQVESQFYFLQVKVM